MTLSISEFQKTIESEVRKICIEFGYKYDTEAERGWAFQIWFARLLTRHDRGLDTDPDDSVLRSKELGIDVLMADEDRQHQYMVQCKFTGTSRSAKQAATPEDKVSSFFRKHIHLMDRKWVRDNASGAALELLGDYPDKISNGWTMTYVYVETANASDRVRDVAKTISRNYRDDNINIRCVLLDLSTLKDWYTSTDTLDQAIPDSVELDLPANSFFVLNNDYSTVVAAVKGNWLRNLYEKHRESLFAWNIRNYLGNRGLNREIADTAEREPGHFFYYNNGISAICKKLSISGNRVTATKFQIINGAQTVGAIARSNLHADIAVLFRLTETGDVNIESGINRNIIQYNNTQNVIKLSDFRSNDKIQLWLEKKFDSVKNYESWVKTAYLRKRGQHAGASRSIRFEDLAKIRYAYKYEPTLLYERPKDLWTMREDGGKYECAFGDGDQVLDMWPDDMFEEAMFAIVLAQKIESEVKAEKKDGRSYLHRLRFHILSLMGLCVRSWPSELNIHAMLKNSSRLQDFWDKAWPQCRQTLISIYHVSVGVDAEKMTLHAFMRSDSHYHMLTNMLVDTAKLRRS